MPFVLSLLKMLLRNKGGRDMDPLQVSMTGVRMGERFLLVGCYDRALLSGLAAKVGLSGTAALASFDDEQANRAAKVGAKVGALIETRPVADHTLPFDSDHFDMVVVDDTTGAFAALAPDARAGFLRDARRTVRRGGRIEMVEGTVTRAAGYDALGEMDAAGFKPVRVLAERDGFRFLEGLRTS